MGRWMVFKLCSNKKAWGEDCTRGFKPPNPASSRAAFKKKLFEKKTSWVKKESSWKITRLPWTFLLGVVKMFIGTFSKLLWKNPNEPFGQSNPMLTFYESIHQCVKDNDWWYKHQFCTKQSCNSCFREAWERCDCLNPSTHPSLWTLCVLVLSCLVAQLCPTLCMFYCSVYKQKRF